MQTNQIEPVRTALWDLLERCNLRCKYCYHLVNGDEWSGKSTPIDKARIVLKRLATEGVDRVYFVGGEPFLYPDFAEVLNEAKSLGLSTLVTTNGTVLKAYNNPEIMRNVDIVELSLDSLDESYLKSIGRLPRLDIIERSIDTLLSLDKTVHLISVATKENLHDLPKIYEFCRNKGLPVWKIQPVWLASDVPWRNELALNLREMRELRDLARNIYAESPQVRSYFNFLEECVRTDSRCHTCTAFQSFVYITVDGVMHRCPSLTDPLSNSLFEVSKQKCNKMSLDCLCVYSLIEAFYFRLKE